MYPRNDDQFTRSQGGGASTLKMTSILKKRNKSQFDAVVEETENDKSDKQSVNEEEDTSSYKASLYSNGTLAPSTVYEIINKAINKEKLTITFPKKLSKRISYIFLIPLTHA